MYNEIIEALIKAALADGVLTEKEKQILFKRAQTEGIDLDEFEMVLNARLVELQKVEKAAKSDKFGDVRKCPACGAIISSGIAVCKKCGYTFTESVSTLSKEKLYNMLAQIDKQYDNEPNPITDLKRMMSMSRTKQSSKLKASAIINFSIPNIKADLLDFCSFLVVLANPEASKEYVSGWHDEHEDLGYAYWLLFSSCITKAKISFAKDDDFAPFYAKYQEMLVASKKFRLSKKAKFWIVYLAFSLLGMGLFAFGCLHLVGSW